jgi:hypothetical protein
MSNSRSARRSGIESLLTKRCQQGEHTLLATPDKEDAMTMARTASLPWPAPAKVLSPDIERAGDWQRANRTLRRLWAGLIALPDRGGAATPDDVPREFYRFPPL